MGFHTSHRTLIRGTNDGDSHYGPATMRDVDVLVIANCVSLENRIFLEHVCYNTSSMLLQLGLDLDEVAGRLASSPPPGWPRDAATWRGLRASVRPEQPLWRSEPVDGFDVDRFVREDLDAAWQRRDHAALAAARTPGFSGRGPGDHVFVGAPAYCDFIDSFTAQFPDLDLRVDEVYWMGNEREGFLSAARWSVTGTHTGRRPLRSFERRPGRSLGHHPARNLGRPDHPRVDALQRAGPHDADRRRTRIDDGEIPMTDFQTSKALVRRFHDELDAASGDGIGEALQRWTADAYHFRGMHPFYEQWGADVVAEVFWKPFRRALGPIQRRQDIFMAGINEIDGNEWVCSMGHPHGALRPGMAGHPAHRQDDLPSLRGVQPHHGAPHRARRRSSATCSASCGRPG